MINSRCIVSEHCNYGARADLDRVSKRGWDVGDCAWTSLLNFDDGGCGTMLIRSHNRVPVGWRGIRGIGCNGELLLSLAVLLVLAMEWS